MSQQLESYTYYCMNKYYVEEGKIAKGLLVKCMLESYMALPLSGWVSHKVFTGQRLEAKKKLRRGF